MRITSIELRRGLTHGAAWALLVGAAAGCDLVPLTPAGLADSSGETVQLVALPRLVTLQPSDSQQFRAVGLLRSGDSVPVSVSWSASGGAVAPTGLYVAGTEPGAFLVIAEAADDASLTDTSFVTISEQPPPPVASVGIVPSAATIAVGATVQLTATTRDAEGNVLDGRTIAWSSSDTTVATVDGAGLVTGRAEGNVSVTASSEGRAGTATITVQPGSGGSGVPVPTLSHATLPSPEPVCANGTTIVCEDFESDDRSAWSDYSANGFTVEADDAFGGTRAMRQRYDLGQVDAGYLAWFLGDHPQGGVRSGESFEEVYLRWYHKFQDGWGDEYPPKMARMRSHYVSCSWCFAWKEHFWLLEDGTARSDPVSNIIDVNGTEYSDSQRWLGQRSADFSFADYDGQWVALEMRVKLNTPGQDDGRITFWANGAVILDRDGVNLRGAYTATTINVAMIDTYWNGGAAAAGLRRWYDNVVVATEPVGCSAFSVSKQALAAQTHWQLQIARDATGQAPVWDSGAQPGGGTTIEVSPLTGTFAEGIQPCLLPSMPYVMRARQATAEGWSEWSEWTPVF